MQWKYLFYQNSKIFSVSHHLNHLVLAMQRRCLTFPCGWTAHVVGRTGICTFFAYIGQEDPKTSHGIHLPLVWQHIFPVLQAGLQLLKTSTIIPHHDVNHHHSCMITENFSKYINLSFDKNKLAKSIVNLKGNFSLD